MIREFYNIDCMEYMETVPDKHFDLAIVDPPYGIGCDTKTYGTEKYPTNYKNKTWNDSIPSKEYFEELYRVSKNRIIWGCNFYGGHVKDVGRIVWDKKIRNNVFSHCDIASQSKNNINVIFEYMYLGFYKEGVSRKEIRIHPTQKPVALYRWVLQNYAKPGQIILDTHVGSGSSLIACIEEGFDYVGCEIDKEYYDNSFKRIDEHLSQGKLFPAGNHE